MTFLYLAIALGILLLAAIRLAPSDPARWHVSRPISGDKDFAAGAIRVIDGGAETLRQIHEIALDTPRTQVLAGGPDSGMTTYLTRSLVFGFPDYTTVRAEGGKVQLYARLRFGRSDSGVNRARVEGWIAALEAR